MNTALQTTTRVKMLVNYGRFHVDQEYVCRLTGTDWVLIGSTYVPRSFVEEVN